MRRFNALDWVIFIALIVGGLNWGLIAFFDYNLVESLFGAGTTITQVIYGIVGLSALYTLVRLVMRSVEDTSENQLMDRFESQMDERESESRRREREREHRGQPSYQ